ncbi:3-methyladenine DNA glycosylase/8-oxoguanine DNA glycosylase [Paraoerskovia marina]|uniref:DNA-3-methyladenine glycosylase II n=1 Tax=Paraoerskovia marina TaxID=545619 RepID=A0A1H1P0Y9_9CELL|nr:DNA-3-methyladenine glycosylase [Paraoerskovia marina]SDS04872.1 3-methyladenine DNA glycosylase/8-oxoguanine DNA glycosylase [Paraoerskovia marina]
MSSTHSPDAEVRHVSDRPLSLGDTLGLLARGPYDPVQRRLDGTVWRTALLPSGPVTTALVADGPRSAVVRAWGPGAEEAIHRVPTLLGELDDATTFTPPAPVREAHHQHPGLRIPRTDEVAQAFVGAILDQRVTSIEAFGAWGRLVRRFGTPAPGPAPDGMRVAPAAADWARIPTWEWQQAGVDPGRARTVTSAMARAASLERLGSLPAAEAQERLTSLPGVGRWTASEVACRAWGDADVVPVGDFHVAYGVVHAFTGEHVPRPGPGVRTTGLAPADAQMLELLEPSRPHRFRVLRLLALSGRGERPRRGPRAAPPTHLRH